MDNSTIIDNNPHENMVNQQVVGYILAGVLSLISLYLSIAMALYGYKTRRKCREIKSMHHITKATEGGALHNLLLCGSSLLVIREILEFVELRIAFYSDSGCNNVRFSKNIVYAVTIALPYIVLWRRQRLCYKSPILHGHSSSITRLYSKTIIIEMILGDMAALALFLFTREYVSSYRGCVLHYSIVWSKAPAVILLVCTISFQLILLFLFVVPVYKVRRSSELRGLSDVSNMSEMMIRVGILSAIIIIVDAICAVVSWRFSSSLHTNIRQQIYDISLISCYICVIASFKDWKSRLCLFCSASTSSQSVSTGTNVTRPTVAVISA